MQRKGSAVWQGGLKDGKGTISTESGVLRQTQYSFSTRFENGTGTNPEELLAAAHAGCFTMALAFGLQAGGYTPTELTTEAAVTLEPEGQGAAPLSHCARKYPIWMKRPLLEWRAMPRRTVRSRRCLTLRSRWMPS